MTMENMAGHGEKEKDLYRKTSRKYVFSCQGMRCMLFVSHLVYFNITLVVSVHGARVVASSSKQGWEETTCRIHKAASVVRTDAPHDCAVVAKP